MSNDKGRGAPIGSAVYASGNRARKIAIVGEISVGFTFIRRHTTASLPPCTNSKHAQTTPKPRARTLDLLRLPTVLRFERRGVALHEANQRHAQHAAELDQLRHIDAVVALLTLGNEALRTPQTIRYLALGESRCFARLAQLL